MGKNNKWIYVDDQFHVKYPRLWEVVKQALVIHDAAITAAVKVGFSNNGNFKIDSPYFNMIVIEREGFSDDAKEELRNLAQEDGISETEIQKNRNEAYEKIKRETPYAGTADMIRKTLGKPNWDFSLSVKLKKKSFLMTLNCAECQNDEITIHMDNSFVRSHANDQAILQQYLAETMGKRLAAKAQEISMHRRQAIRAAFIHKQESVLKIAIAKEISEYFGTISFDKAPITYKVKRANNRVTVEIQYDQMLFSCKVFAANGHSDLTVYKDLADMKWLQPYIQIEKNPSGLDDDITANVETPLKKILENRRSQMIEQLNQCQFTLSKEVLPNQYAEQLLTKANKCLYWSIPYIDGKSPISESDVHYSFNLQNPYPRLENAAGSIIFTPTGIVEQESILYQHFLAYDKDKFQERCREYAIDAFKLYQSISCKPGACGILYGDTMLTITKGELVLHDYLYHTHPYTDSVTTWRKDLAKNLVQIDKEFVRLATERKQNLMNDYSDYVNSFLVRDIIEFVSKNEDYITPRAVTQALRGTAISLNAPIIRTENCGRYSFFSADDVDCKIDMLIQNKVLISKTIKGTYGDFDILKIPQTVSSVLPELKEACLEMEAAWSEKKSMEIQKKIRTKQSLTDPEADQYLQHNLLRNKDFGIAEYMELFYMISNLAILEKYEDRIICIFNSVPDIVKQYVKLQYSQIQELRIKRIVKKIFAKCFVR